MTSRAPIRQGGVKATARAIFWGLLIALVLRAFVVEAFEIPSGSMIPTLEIGDRVVVTKFSYGVRLPFTDAALMRWSSPQRGDVVVFSDPDRRIDLIKRVVAVGGDTIEVKNDVLYVNGRPVTRQRAEGDCAYDDRQASYGAAGWGQFRCEAFLERLGEHAYRTVYAPGHPPISIPPTTVPPDNVFVMGDHRDASSDSRVFGSVPANRIRGRARAVFWSRGESVRWGRLGSAIR
jgi:signal peptidase I